MTDITNQKIGKHLRQIRRDSHLTQTELAKKAGMPTNTLARLERGEHRISSESAEKLAKALGVKASDILLY
jgi:transcriptional regulator with XRE-family HTH domain